MQFLRRCYSTMYREVLLIFFHFLKDFRFSPPLSPRSLQDHKKEAILLANNCRETQLPRNRNSPASFRRRSRFPLTVKEDGDLLGRDSNFLAQNWLKILELHGRKHDDVSDVDFPLPVEEDYRKRYTRVGIHHRSYSTPGPSSAEDTNQRTATEGFYKKSEPWWGFTPKMVILLRRWGHPRNMKPTLMLQTGRRKKLQALLLPLVAWASSHPTARPVASNSLVYRDMVIYCDDSTPHTCIDSQSCPQPVHVANYEIKASACRGGISNRISVWCPRNREWSRNDGKWWDEGGWELRRLSMLGTGDMNAKIWHTEFRRTLSILPKSICCSHSIQWFKQRIN